MRPHVLSRELESLLALSSKALETPYKAFGALNNADMTFAPAETSAGEKKELTNGHLSSLYARSRPGAAERARLSICIKDMKRMPI